MSDLSIFSDHPYRFIRKILGGYFWSHVTIALAVVGAVTCSVSTQYGVKYLVDACRTRRVTQAFGLHSRS